MRTAGIIAAATKGMTKMTANPLMEIGSISVIKRVVLTLQQSGISPIVVITGHQAEDIEYHLSDFDVIFLRNKNFAQAELIDSAKLGMKFLQGKCERVLFTPVDIPMFSPDTIKRMISAKGDIISPSYQGKSGHPLLLSAVHIPAILAYKSENGLRGVLNDLGIKRIWLDVKDEGILYDMNAIEQMDWLIAEHNKKIIHPFLRISIERGAMFFNSRTKLLLVLIHETNSVRSACRHMALSYSKAWNMLNQLETELGYEVVTRRHGGSYGGRTSLTAAGIKFLERYQQFEFNVRQFAKAEFEGLFQELIDPPKASSSNKEFDR